MSLSLLQSTIPIRYELCQPGDGAVYRPELCTPPRTYRETFFNLNNSIDGFWYDAAQDAYILNVQMKYALWPSFRRNKYTIDAETGLDAIGRVDGSSGVGIDAYENGEFGKVYAQQTGGSFTSVVEIDPVTLGIVQTVMDEDDLPGSPNIGRFLINRQDSILVSEDTIITSVYDYTAVTLLGQFAMPALTVQDLAYEDNERGWAVMPGFDGIPTIVKFNYKSIEVEAVTGIQAGTAPDFQVLIAYDSKRKVLAVFRQREDATDGAAEHVLDLYKPFAVPTNMSAPIPMSQPQPGQVVTMVAHVYGDRGEVGQAKAVTITNSGDGTILQPTVTPRTNGAVVFQYLSGENPGSDVITLQVDL